MLVAVSNYAVGLALLARCTDSTRKYTFTSLLRHHLAHAYIAPYSYYVIIHFHPLTRIREHENTIKNVYITNSTLLQA